MRVFLDANVLFSACLRQGNRQYAFFELARAGRCALLTSSYALEETQRNLVRKAPPQAQSMLPTLIGLLEPMAEAPPEELLVWAEAQGLPAKDAPILAAAVQAGADLLVTGDRRHFGPLFGRSLQGVRILSLADGLAAVLAAAERGRH
jgi:predicted nucleic acid-binding protein